MVTSESQLKAIARYDKKSTIGIYLKFNKVTDSELLEFLKEKKNRQGYIKELIKLDIQRNK